MTGLTGTGGAEVPPDIDPRQPCAARVYDYMLGGSANFEADRQAAHMGAEAYPGGLPAAKAIARQNRDLLGRAVHYLVEEQGIRQFLDLGTGIPSNDNVHAIAQGLAPESRIVCVDYDPVVLAHAHVLMSSTPEGAARFLRGDFREHERMLDAAAETLDLGKPVAVMLIALLHLFRESDEPYELVDRYMEALPSGSYLVLTHLTNDLVEMSETARRLSEAMTEPMVLRSRSEVARFFDKLELVDPGVVPVTEWHPDGEPETGNVVHLGGVGRKP